MTRFSLLDLLIAMTFLAVGLSAGWGAKGWVWQDMLANDSRRLASKKIGVYHYLPKTRSIVKWYEIGQLELPRERELEIIRTLFERNKLEFPEPT